MDEQSENESADSQARLRNDLSRKKVPELLKIARRLNVRGRHGLQKEQLIQAIMERDNLVVRRSMSSNWVAMSVSWLRSRSGFIGMWASIVGVVLSLITMFLWDQHNTSVPITWPPGHSPDSGLNEQLTENGHNADTDSEVRLVEVYITSETLPVEIAIDGLPIRKLTVGQAEMTVSLSAGTHHLAASGDGLVWEEQFVVSSERVIRIIPKKEAFSERRELQTPDGG